MASFASVAPSTVMVAPNSELIVTTTAAALSTTFTPPASCAEQRLTIASPNYFLWMNDPQPVDGVRMSDCYPSQWMEQYTSLAAWSMSIAPMMSPLVCPSAWTTVSATYANLPDYIACCPKDYGLTQPKKAMDKKRPAYGGTCYSPMASGRVYTVTKYDNASSVGVEDWLTDAITDNAYAHPIDGYRASKVVLTTDSSGSVAQVTPTTDSSSSSGTGVASNPNNATASNDASASLSGGAIAGIVIGVVGGLALIAVAVFLLFRRRRQQRNAAGSVGEAGGAGAAARAAEKPDPDVYEAPESPHGQYSNQLHGQYSNELHGQHSNELHGQHAREELPNNTYYVAELGPSERSELPSNYHGHELR